MTTTDRSTQNAQLSKPARILLHLLPTIIAVLVMAGGWVANFGADGAVLRDHEHRLKTIEDNYLPRSEQAAKDALRSERDSDLEKRLERIENKLDQALIKASH